ncbi:MAG: hypothetical protein ACRC5M_02690, partial [Anaeroplasmataceae bacterium]
MFYTFFMKKNLHDKPPLPTTTLIQKYIYQYGDSDLIISVPGYMSTKSHTADDFLNNMRIPNSTYFTVGMNGTIDIDYKGSGIQIQNYYNRNSNIIVSNPVNIKDHSKMLFFIANDNTNNIFDFKKLTNYQVKAILIGSSNQSKGTYFASNHGEADIFIIDGNYLKPVNDDNYLKPVNVDDQIINFYNDLTVNDSSDSSELLKKRILLSKQLIGDDDFLNN